MVYQRLCHCNENQTNEIPVKDLQKGLEQSLLLHGNGRIRNFKKTVIQAIAQMVKYVSLFEQLIKWQSKTTLIIKFDRYDGTQRHSRAMP